MASPEAVQQPVVENPATFQPVDSHDEPSLMDLAGQILDWQIRRFADPSLETMKVGLHAGLNARSFLEGQYSYTPGDAGFVANVENWSGVDLSGQYGFRKTADGFKVDRIPGPDGTTYGIDIDRSGTRQPAEQVWRLDAQGNKVPVTDRQTIKQVADAANKMFDVWSSKNVLEQLGLSDEEIQYVDRFMNAVKAQDTATVEQMLQQYSGNTDRLGDLFVAMFCEQALRNMDGYHIGLLHLGNSARFLLTYPGAPSTLEFNVLN